MDKRKLQNLSNNNILEEDFVNIFLPIYRLQFIMGSCRVHTKSRFVTPPTPLQKCYTILCFLLTIGSIYAVVAIYYDLMPDKSVSVLGMSVVISIFAASFCNTAHVRFINNRQNAMFHVKLQKLDRLMGIDKHKSINAILKRTNVVAAFLILIVFVSFIAVACVTQQYKALSFLGITLCLLSFILELIVCSNKVVYFLDRVRFVNYMIDSYLKQDDNSVTLEKKSNILDLWVSMTTIKSVAKDTNNFFTTSEVDNYLKEIFSCFVMFQDLYRFQLLLFCIKLVVISLMSFEMVLYSMSNNIYSTSQVVTLAVLMIIDSFIAAFLAFRFGIFFAEVKETKRLCIAVLALHQEGALRAKAKTMLNMIEETPPKFSVYDMWDINAGIFVSIFSLVTSLIVTMIQFAYL